MGGGGAPGVMSARHSMGRRMCYTRANEDLCGNLSGGPLWISSVWTSKGF